MHVLFPLATGVHEALEQERSSAALGSIEATLLHLRRSRPQINDLGFGVKIVQVTTDIVMKSSLYDQSNHHIALQYLADHSPDVPAPQALGLVRVGHTSYLFMTLIPGQTVASVWATLDTTENVSIQMKLEEACRRYRLLKAGEDTAIGPLTGVKCENQQVFAEKSEHHSCLHPLRPAVQEHNGGQK